jgi:hypothetical protein
MYRNRPRQLRHSRAYRYKRCNKCKGTRASACSQYARIIWAPSSRMRLRCPIGRYHLCLSWEYAHEFGRPPEAQICISSTAPAASPSPLPVLSQSSPSPYGRSHPRCKREPGAHHLAALDSHRYQCRNSGSSAMWAREKCRSYRPP